MPNYCENSVTIIAPTEELFKKLEEADYNSFMSSFKPTPEDLGNGWRIGEWGTKWDFGFYDFELSSDTKTLVIPYFDTAWSPPIKFYDFLTDMGYEVKAYYYEPGCNFCGRYDEDGDTYFGIDGGSAWVRKNIPSDIDYEFAIADNLAENEEEFDDDDDEMTD